MQFYYDLFDSKSRLGVIGSRPFCILCYESLISEVIDEQN
jgi:hypothetical protein